MTTTQPEPVREDIVRQLEQFSVEVLEVALFVIRSREQIKSE